MQIPYALTLMTFVPLLGAIVLLFIPNAQEKLIKNLAIVISLVPLLISLMIWAGFDDAGGSQFVEDAAWIPAVNVRYHLGIDGLSLPLVILTTLLITLGLWYSARVVHKRVKEFFALFLVLEMGMLGVFIALDLILFYFSGKSGWCRCSC